MGRRSSRARHLTGALVIACALAAPAALRADTTGQDPHQSMAHQHDAAAPGWHFMQDGAVFLMLNRQGGDRGGETEIKAPNGWMGMAQRRVGRGALTIDLMLSLDAATIGSGGYREIFQVGETYRGVPLIDHQHPHDFLMKAAASYRFPIGGGYSVTLAGGPVSDPALGPTAFMHRLSSYENPIAPISHHTLDSTHIAMGVLTGGVDRGPFQVEASTFHGREPDEQRWDLMDPGPLDSWSVRGWYRPSAAWSFQVSHGYLTEPDVSEEGDVRRTTASASWTRRTGDRWTAVTGAWGRNTKIGGDYNAFLLEATHDRVAGLVLFGRAEYVQVETDVLRFGVHTFQGGRKKAHVVIPGTIDYLPTWPLGASRDVWKPGPLKVAAAGDVTGYIVPSLLRPTHGDHPVSFHLYLRVRVASGQ